MSSFDALIADAIAAPFIGWDFSWLRGRFRIEPLPWSYSREVIKAGGAIGSMVDMGTGGGEVLSGITPRPAVTVATEAWQPNVPIAGRRLRELGISVVQDEGAPDNFDQDGVRGRLPFRDGSFGLVASRHEAFLPDPDRRGRGGTSVLR